MPKRIAGSQLHQDNWDAEDEKEDDGGQVGIPVASAEEMKSRVIKVARRKGLATASGNEPSKSAFTGFGGFGALKPQASGFGSLTQKSHSTTNISTTTTTATSTNGNKEVAKPDEYYAKLRALNESVSAWIKQHVDKNPYCILTPVFKDYETHLEKVEKLNPEKSDSNASTISYSGTTTGSDSKLSENKHVSFDLKEKKDETSKPAFSIGSTEPTKGISTVSGGFSFTPKPQQESKILSPKVSLLATKSENENSETAPKFSFGLVKTGNESKSAESAPKFSFGGAGTESKSSESASKFSFGTTSSAASGGFSFGLAQSGSEAKPFSFATGASSSVFGGSTNSTAASGDAEDEEYVPPKPEVQEVKEDGATYSKRCKLFWMTEGSWKERGLGNLHLKPLDSGKTQLVMRADTNLGNILLNILLNDSVLVSRSGKNMINIICITNPPFDPKNESEPQKLLFKVKTSEDADEMFGKIEEAKKQ